MLKPLALAISIGGLLVVGSSNSAKELPTAKLLCQHALTTSDIPGYDHSTGPVAQLEMLSDMPAFRRAFPGKTFVPGTRIWSRQELSKFATAESGASKIQVYIQIYSNLDHALVFDSPVVMNEGISNAYGYKMGTFSGFPVGDGSRFVPNPSDPNRSRVPAARITAREGNVIVSAQFDGQPIRSRGTPSLPKLTLEDKLATECAARIALSNGYIAAIDFRRISSTSTKVGAIATQSKLLPNRGEVVLLDRIAKLKIEYGILEFSFNGKKLKTGIGAKEILIGGRRVPLSVPIIYDRGQIWIERQGLTKAIN